MVNPEDGIAKNLISSISHTDVRRDSQDDDESVAGIQRNHKQQVPALVQACVNHLLKYGLNQVGIFRVSTSKRRVRQVKYCLLNHCAVSPVDYPQSSVRPSFRFD